MKQKECSPTGGQEAFHVPSLSSAQVQVGLGGIIPSSISRLIGSSFWTRSTGAFEGVDVALTGPHIVIQIGHAPLKGANIALCGVNGFVVLLDLFFEVRDALLEVFLLGIQLDFQALNVGGKAFEGDDFRHGV